MNENKEFFEILGNNINYLIIDDKILSGGTFEIKRENYINGYFSNRLYFNNNLVKLKNTKINYKCYYCNESNIILLKRFLSKKTLICRKCKELDKDKRKKQSNYIKNSFKKYNKIKRKIKEKNNETKKIDFIVESNKLFNNENTNFKNNYFNNHLSNNDFEKLKNKIHSVNGIMFNLDYIFYEHLKTNNQIKYSNYLYDENNNIYINFNNVKFICDNCDSVFSTSRKPKEKISNYKILCRKCSMSNKVFKVKHLFNINNEKVTYQSAPELKLINFCNKNNILIQNGFDIKYFFDNKNRTYNIDFYIPSKKLLIEIKDNHIWHKNQIKTGKWKIKEMKAVEYAKNNGLDYKLIFTQYLDDFLNTF